MGWAGKTGAQRLRGPRGGPSLGFGASPSPSSQGSWGPVQYRCSCKMKKIKCYELISKYMYTAMYTFE